MAGKPESVTINDLQSLELDADLTIMFSECPKLPKGRKIHMVGGEPFADRGSLRVAFSAITPDSFVEVVLYEEVQDRVDIDDSVELDGMKTKLKPPSEWINSDDDEDEGGSLPPSTGMVAAYSSGSSKQDVDNTRVKAGQMAGGGGGASNSPQLLEFTKLDMSSQADFLSVDAGGFSRSGLMDALNNVPRGHAIILLCEMINPVAEVEILSRLMRREFVVHDCGSKLRLRPGQNEVASSFMECMTHGRWYVVLNAQKSINTLRVIDSLMNELRVGGSIKFHPAARIIISTDPHPHFPPGLLEKGITMKLRQSFSRSHMTESLMASVSRRKILGATMGGAIHPGASTSNTSSAFGSGTSIGGGGPGQKKRPRVQMSAAVEVVEIPSRDVMTSAVSKPSGPITGRIVREKEFTGLEGDKFLCISSCGRGSDRIAVGSSLGNVYFLDYYGQAVSSMHAHDACVWDIDSQSPGSFVTGSEDCSTIRWNASADGTAQQNQVAKCGHDIFAVTFMGADANSPIFLGGLMSVVVCLSPKGQARQIPAPSSTQALCAMPTTGKVIGGGGDGSIMVIDAETCGMDQVINSHKKKVPCVAHNDSMIISGSFDCTIKLWDTKSLTDPVHTLKLKNYVTGVGVDGNILAASVGENLYMWDLRMPSEVLGGFPQAWSGLSRGLVVNSDTKQVVTASPDGVVRFWRYQ